MARLSTITKLAAVALVAAAATLVLPVSPAQAAYCSSGGVSVLVDFGALGGGTSTACGGGAKVASDAFTKAGFGLSRHPRQPSFVCKVAGKPADGNCIATNAYWGFFVSDDGKGWAYASVGVFQQAVDSGDSVALVWQSSGSERKPGTAPAPSTQAPTTPKPTPKPKPTKRPEKPTATASTEAATSVPTPRRASSPTGQPADGEATRPVKSATPSATTSPTTSPTLSASTADAGAEVSVSSSPSASPTTTAATEPTAAESDGLPGWVAPGIIALLALAAGGLAWARRVR